MNPVDALRALTGAPQRRWESALVEPSEGLSRLIAAEELVVRLPLAETEGPREHRVLVVDDDPDIPVLVQAAMAPYRIRTEAVQSGKDALSRVTAHNYALLILDLGMEDVNGLEVLRDLKRERRLRHLPVLILTGDHTNDALARSFGYGADDLVTKPFNRGELGIRAYRLIEPFR